MKIDNPNSKYHFRYHRIIDRLTFAIVSLLIMGTIYSIEGTVESLIVFPLAMAVLIMVGTGVVVALACVAALGVCLINFFSGHDFSL